VKSLALLGLVAGVLLGTALTSPWVAAGVTAAVAHRFNLARVYDRVFEVLLAGTLVLGWRRLDLGRPAELGFRRRGWARELGRGVALGLAGLAAGLALCAAFGALVPALRYPPGKTLRKAVLGAAAALAVALGEEALFRGVLLRRLERDGGRTAAITVTTLVYAAVHLMRTHGSPGPVHPWSGFSLTLGLFAPLADRAALPRLAGLLVLGALLAAARLRSGALWLPVGIHAAFVAVFRVGRLFVVIPPGPAWLVGAGWPPLIGGAAGWMALGVVALLLGRSPARARRAALVST